MEKQSLALIVLTVLVATFCVTQASLKPINVPAVKKSGKSDNIISRRLKTRLTT